jgi:hypothetical protein
MQETQRLLAEPVQGISAIPDESNSRYFHVVVAGPKDVCIDCFFFALGINYVVATGENLASQELPLVA